MDSVAGGAWLTGAMAGAWQPSGGTLAEGERAGFRRRHVRLESGQLLEWRQLGVGGSRYLLARLHDGQELLTVRNTGGALRWSGSIDVHETALTFGPVLPLLALFSTFLVFCSSELGF
jgi:hypothetical protein